MKLYGIMSEWAFDNIGEEEGEGTWCQIFLDKQGAYDHMRESLASELDTEEVFHLLEFDLLSNEKWGVRVTLTPISKV